MSSKVYKAAIVQPLVLVGLLSSVGCAVDTENTETDIREVQQSLTYTETTDAGDLPGTAEDTPDGVTQIDGILQTRSDVDLYKICLEGGGTFSATTDGGPVFDSQLYLFDENGLGIYFNDDIHDPGNRLSTLPSNHALTPTDAGVYYLAVVSYNNNALSSAGSIFPTAPFGDVVGPTGPGGTQALSSWDLNGSHAGSYSVFLTGTASCAEFDLSTSISDSVDPAPLGDNYSYTVSVDNINSVDATGVSSVTTLSGDDHNIVTVTSSQGSCSTSGSTVNCALGSLAASASASITITVEAQEVGSITADTAVTADQTDSDPANDSATESTTVDNSLGCTIVGTPGNDTISGTTGDDVICGLGGDDVIEGGNGDDIIYGGSGDDTLDGENGKDTIYGGEGNDILGGGNGQDVIYGGPGNDSNYGETFLGGLLYLFDNGNDTIYGGPGDDILDGQKGNDILIDEDGTDHMKGGQGNDTIDVGDGEGGDTADGGSGSDTCYVDAGDTAISC